MTLEYVEDQLEAATEDLWIAVQNRSGTSRIRTLRRRVKRWQTEARLLRSTQAILEPPITAQEEKHAAKSGGVAYSSFDPLYYPFPDAYPR